MPTPNAPDSFYRSKEGLGRWEHSGKVAAVGMGHSPTARRWDGKPETSVGAWTILAIRQAMEDAGVTPDQVNGLVLAEETTTGAYWLDRPIPEDFRQAYQQTADPLDGLAKLSAEWILKNMPELTNVKFTMYAPGCMSNVCTVAAEAVGRGLTNTCLVVKGWHNFPGRYYQGGANAADTIFGPAKWRNPWGGPACWGFAIVFDEYCRKYGKTHEMMAPFVINERRNGLLFPEGYWAQHRPQPLTVEDYLGSRWIAKPANIFDNDIPIQVSAAYIFTTADRVKDMKQKPVYILNHASDRSVGRGMVGTLEEWEEAGDATGRKLFEGAGISASDVSFENMYDGFTIFHHFHMEGLRYAGIKRGEGLDLYQTDISIEGPNPVSPSGGNTGGGRSRFWNSTDCMQQIQGRAGARQMTKKAEIGISGGPAPTGGNFVVWSATPN